MFPFCHIVQVPTNGNASTKAFHNMEPLEDLIGDRNHSSIDKFGKYLEFITLVQREFPLIILHRFHPTKARSKARMSFKPQPPNSFGVAMDCEDARWIPPLSFCPTHKKWKQTLRILSRTPLGIAAIEFQYTEMLSRTDLINTSWPPFRKHPIHPHSDSSLHFSN